jgi:peptide/nickel transport system substrate-binding protein
MKFFELVKTAILAIILAMVVNVPVLAKTPADTFVSARDLSELTSVDPAEFFNLPGNRLVVNTYDRLVMFEPDDMKKLVGGIAKSWTITNGGKRITFKLRPGLTFHSGNPVTAHDVVYSFTRVIVLDKSPAFLFTQFGWNKDNMDKAVIAVNDLTVQVNLFSHLAGSLAINAFTPGVGSIVDSKLVKSHAKGGDMGNGWLRLNEAGSGPYIMKLWKDRELLSLERFDKDRHGPANLKRIIIRHVPEASVQRLLLEKGDIDAAMELTADQFRPLKGRKDIKLLEWRSAEQIYLGINMFDPIMKNRNMREAMKHVIDHETLLKTLLKDSWIAHQTFWPAGLWASYTGLPHTFDLELARSFVVKAGYGDGVSITIDAQHSSPKKDIVQHMVENLKKIGVNAEILLHDSKTFYPKYRARKHQLLIAGWAPDFADPHSNADCFTHNPNNLFEAKNTGKITWRNAWAAVEETKLTNAAAVETDPNKRYGLYVDLQRRAQDDSSFIFLYQALGVFAVRSNVNNLVTGLTPDMAYFRIITK